MPVDLKRECCFQWLFYYSRLMTEAEGFKKDKCTDTLIQGHMYVRRKKRNVCSVAQVHTSVERVLKLPVTVTSAKHMHKFNSFINKPLISSVGGCVRMKAGNYRLNRLEPLL